MMRSWSLLFLLGSIAFAAEPIPLGETPALPTESSHEIEVLQKYSIPNPEDVAVHPSKTFFLTGTNDGYVHKVDMTSGASELILTPRDFASSLFVNQTNDEIREYCNGDNVTKESTCGRVLGIKFHISDDNCTVVMANAYFGVFQTTTCESPRSVRQLVNITGGFVNDVLPMNDSIYYTVTHDSKQRNELPYVVMDSDAPRGTLHSYDTLTETTQLLSDGIFFANGIVASSNGEYIYVSETTAARIRKFHIKTLSMEEEYLIDDLPIFTDNIWVENGVLLVPGYWRNANLDSLLRSPDELTTFLAQSPAVVVPTFQSWIAPVGVLLLIDEDSGEITDTIFNNGTGFALASSAHKLGEDEYIVGSVFVGAATRF